MIIMVLTPTGYPAGRGVLGVWGPWARNLGPGAGGIFKGAGGRGGVGR